MSLECVVASAHLMYNQWLDFKALERRHPSSSLASVLLTPLRTFLVWDLRETAHISKPLVFAQSRACQRSHPHLALCQDFQTPPIRSLTETHEAPSLTSTSSMSQPSVTLAGMLIGRRAEGSHTCTNTRLELGRWFLRGFQDGQRL